MDAVHTIRVLRLRGVVWLELSPGRVSYGLVSPRESGVVVLHGVGRREAALQKKLACSGGSPSKRAFSGGRPFIGPSPSKSGTTRPSSGNQWRRCVGGRGDRGEMYWSCFGSVSKMIAQVGADKRMERTGTNHKFVRDVNVILFEC